MWDLSGRKFPWTGIFTLVALFGLERLSLARKMFVAGSFLAGNASFLLGFIVKKERVRGFFHAAETWLVPLD